MRRAVVLILAGGILTLGGITWLAAAQLGGPGVGRPVSGVVKVDVNQAGPEELSRLPGITPELAERIIRSRPFRRLDDLVTRKVLGKKQFARIRELVVVGRGNP